MAGLKSQKKGPKKPLACRWSIRIRNTENKNFVVVENSNEDDVEIVEMQNERENEEENVEEGAADECNSRLANQFTPEYSDYHAQIAGEQATKKRRNEEYMSQQLQFEGQEKDETPSKKAERELFVAGFQDIDTAGVHGSNHSSCQKSFPNVIVLDDSSSSTSPVTSDEGGNFVERQTLIEAVSLAREAEIKKDKGVYVGVQDDDEIDDDTEQLDEGLTDIWDEMLFAIECYVGQ